MRICIPIQAETDEAAKCLIARAFAVADMVELRLDRMRAPDLHDLLHNLPGTVLVTNRRREEGGAYSRSESERIGRLEAAVALGAQYVDVEAATDRELIARVKEKIKDTFHSSKGVD